MSDSKKAVYEEMMAEKAEEAPPAEQQTPYALVPLHIMQAVGALLHTYSGSAPFGEVKKIWDALDQSKVVYGDTDGIE